MNDPTRLARWFEHFAAVECEDSPLYRRLALGLAGDPSLLALAAESKGGPPPNLLLAAVHYLLLNGPRHALAAFYPSVSGQPSPAEDSFPYFQRFCQDHLEAIRALLVAKRVQTNEVAR